MSVSKKLKDNGLSRFGKIGNGKKIVIISGLSLIIVIVAAATLFGSSGKAGDVMSTEVQVREFVSIVVEKGALKAARTATFNAPRLRYGGGQTILALAPEGEVIEAGDLIVQFDQVSLLEQVENKRREVEEVEAQLTKTLAQQESQMASLEAALEQTQHSHEQASLRMRAMQFESDYRRIQEEYTLKKSTLSLERAEEAITTRKLQNQTALQRTQVRLDRVYRELSDMEAELGQTTQHAAYPGLVIYESMNGPAGETKVSVGSTAYPGQAIISIPDLSSMTVQVGISELDIRRVAMRQKVLITIDAYPDAVYTGEVTDISPLARRSGLSQMKIFDCTVTIDGTDLTLRPGMTAQVSIITHYQPEALVVSMDAVFRQENRTLVFLVDHGIKEVEVLLGADNGIYVVIEEGLSAGMRVAMRDPFMPLEELETAGIDALLERRDVAASSGGGSAGISAAFRMMMGGGGGGGGRGGDRGGGGDMRIFR
ncbi:efflux RND transporter periplasmic adaptor subunit [Gemmatimonadota bacterium]